MGFYSLMGAKVIARSDAWPEFILNLLCFVTHRGVGDRGR